MSKTDIVSSQKAAILSGQDAALQAGLEAVYDLAAQEQKASDGTLTQGDLDAAIKAATDPLNAQIVQDQADLVAAHADADAKLAAVQSALEAMTSKEQLEEKVVSDLQSSVAQVQAALDAIKAIVIPTLPPSV